VSKPEHLSCGASIDAVQLLGLECADFDAAAAANAIAQRPADAPFGYVVTPNADHFMRLARNQELRGIYEGAWMRLLDSRVVARAARLLGLHTPRVAPGSDVAAWLLEHHLYSGEQVTIIGLRPEWVDALKRRYHLTNVAHHNPPMGFEHDAAAFRRAVEFVLSHPARFIFLATGSPRQELLASAIAITSQGHGTGLCVGAALEFLAGARARAPRWMQHAGLEWLHRLGSDPRRMMRRYLWDDPMIFRLLLLDRIVARNR
jgi:N-acetylglucosaminyldiphosphoundecaprenol N-acetyl-beta-D-mannosaminyltransferase